MKCSEIQTNLSLYLYGELDFAQEESIEHHLGECAFCRLALDREKAWHGTVNSGAADVPLELIGECRDRLHQAMRQSSDGASAVAGWKRYFPFFDLNKWSLRLAFASALVFIGFASARWIDRHGLPQSGSDSTTMASVFDPSGSRIREVQASGPNTVRIVVEQIGERQITGSPEDGTIRQLLLAGMTDPLDPGVRIDAVESLKDQPGDDVKQALLNSVRSDPNAAVRLKALEALRRFSTDAATQNTLKYVLQRDENPGVRSEAIDLLVPAGQNPMITPDTLATLENVLSSGQQDDYVRARCLQVLSKVNAAAPIDLY